MKSPEWFNEQFVEQLLNGDQAAFELVIKHNHTMIKRCIRRYLRVREIEPMQLRCGSSDFAQQTYLELYRSISTLNPLPNKWALRSLLQRIAASQVAMEVRRRYRTQKSDNGREIQGVEYPATMKTNPLHQAMRREALKIIESDSEMLEAIIERRIRGESVRSIAVSLSLSKSVVHRLIQEAKELAANAVP